jgi:GDPmannose 4,6-dehydratase
MLQHPEPEDFVIATGESHSVRDFLDLAAGYCGVDWKTCVETDPRYYRPTEVNYLMGDSSKAQRLLGWRPRVCFRELVKLMIEHDLELALQERQILAAGHKVLLREVAHG